MSQKKSNKNKHHEIQHIQISLATRFHLNQKLELNLPKKFISCQKQKC